MLVKSGLRDWNATIELKREPDPPEEFREYSGDVEAVEIEGIAGSMRVITNLTGNRPRGSKPRALTSDYRHVKQILEEFQQLEIAVTTPDGSPDGSVAA